MTINDTTIECIGRQQEAYNLFSQLTKDQQDAAIKAMNLSEKDEKSFRLAMAWMKLFCDEQYNRAVCKAMAEAMYAEFHK